MKVVDNLLVMGLLNDADLRQLLLLIDPISFEAQDHHGSYAGM